MILALNYQTHELSNTCKRYNRTKKAQLDLNQPCLIRKYNAGVDHLDGFMNNLWPCAAEGGGGKKWYWTQLTNFIHLLQDAAFQLLHHSNPEKKISQLQFPRNLVQQYATVQRNDSKCNSIIAIIISRDSNVHFLTLVTPGRCKVFQKKFQINMWKISRPYAAAMLRFPWRWIHSN